jgi:hypothetical protein
MNEDLYQTIDAWLDRTVYVDDGKRRPLILDNDRDRVFFFADPLDFDKDDTHQPARYWIDEFEGYDKSWHEMIVKKFLD